MNLIVVDADGEWFTNVGQFPFVDPISGHRFEPGVKAQIKSNDWIAGQPVLVKEAVEAEPPAKAKK